MSDTHSALVLAVSMRSKLAKDVLKEYRGETPFTASEIQRLWDRFQDLESAGDGDGTLTLAVRARITE